MQAIRVSQSFHDGYELILQVLITKPKSSQ